MKDEIIALSKELNEPKWLLEQRLDALELVEEPERAITEPKKPEIKSSTNVRIMALGDVLAKDPKFAKKAFLSRRILPAISPYAAYLGSHFQDCNFIFVDKNKKAALELSLDSSLALTFMFIGSGSTLRIGGTAVSDCMDICEIVADENSRMDCAFLKQKGAFAYRGFSASMATGSSLCASSFWSGSGYGDSVCELRGVGSKVLNVELSAAGDSERLSLHSDFRHMANDAESEVLMRGVAQDTSHTSFDGKVVVEGNGRGAKSRLSQQVLLLDKGAKVETNPVLEIKNNDVECSHAAAVRQLEEDKLFYMQTRGLSRELAKTTAITGFLRGAINRVENKELRNMFKPPFMQE